MQSRRLTRAGSSRPTWPAHGNRWTVMSDASEEVFEERSAEGRDSPVSRGSLSALDTEQPAIARLTCRTVRVNSASGAARREQVCARG